jgi:hypothetical protein
LPCAQRRQEKQTSGNGKKTLECSTLRKKYVENQGFINKGTIIFLRNDMAVRSRLKMPFKACVGWEPIDVVL